MSVEIEGFEDLSDRLDEVEGADGDLAVSFEELFPADFMRTHTEFDSIDAFFDASGWTVDSRDDFERIPTDRFDAFVDEHTGFNAWESMLSAAARELLWRRLAD